MLDQIFEGVCRPFKVRVDQVLTTAPGMTLSYRLSNLLEFYSRTIESIIGENAHLSKTINECLQASTRTFQELLKYVPYGIVSAQTVFDICTLLDTLRVHDMVSLL